MGGHGRVVLRHPSSCLSSGQGSVAHHQLQERGGSRYKAEGLQGGDRPGARAEGWWRRRHLPIFRGQTRRLPSRGRSLALGAYRTAGCAVLPILSGHLISRRYLYFLGSCPAVCSEQWQLAE